ncbi:GNAT family N-acetyltransferase [Jeotgalibacillus proteolyticus]|uniref:GNAT family N-acetyltransferase n=1 Tax=Jeotgalibacillus proteolyticus TaxID=2082395 RepID=UPI001431A5CB|nr:GNAT family N-acetyltransferase [Jeotgalibacillus proteolyticus]
MRELGSFITQVNSKPEGHIGYCGVEAMEVENTLQEDFSDLKLEDSFIVWKEGGRIIAALGVDWDSEERTGELWGPFNLSSEEKWQLHADILWRLLQHKVNQEGTWYGFYNELNHQAKNWFSVLGGQKKSSEVILHAKPGKVSSRSIGKTEEYSDRYQDEFKRMHQAVFPNTYYSADEILSRKNSKNRLFVSAENNHLLGYVYVEGNPDFKEGSIEFIAVDEQARGKGVGAALLERASAYLFECVDAQEISICVSADNEAAIHLYKKVGFTEKHRLSFYKLQTN